MTRPDKFFKTILALCLASISTTLVCGCNKAINDQSALVIKTNLKHSHRQVELEVDSNEIEKRENQFARDEVTPPGSEPLQKHLAHSIKLVESSKSEEAIQTLNQEIEKNPHNSRAYSYLGKVYRALENYKQAKQAFDRAIKIQPGDPFPYCLRAEMNYHLESYRDAIRDCNQALKLDSEYDQAYAIRGEAYMQIKDYKKAIADFTASARLNPRYSPVLVDLGDAYFELKNYKEAISQYSRAIDLDKDNGIFFARRARAYKLNGNESLFLEDEKKARELGYKIR